MCGEGKNDNLDIHYKNAHRVKIRAEDRMRLGVSLGVSEDRLPLSFNVRLPAAIIACDFYDLSNGPLKPENRQPISWNWLPSLLLSIHLQLLICIYVYVYIFLLLLLLLLPPFHTYLTEAVMILVFASSQFHFGLWAYFLSKWVNFPFGLPVIKSWGFFYIGAMVDFPPF